MTEKPKSIKRNRTLPPTMDYAFLKKQGIEAAQRLSGGIWTDYNEHDPGITILENLCYAMTELGYKTNFEITDLLYAKEENEQRPIDNVLYEAGDVLPCTPLTPTDYRKLIIDRVRAVKNAWVLPKKQSQQGLNLNGLYEVLLQVEDNTDEAAILNEVRKLVNQYRNLCEDFDHIQVLNSEKIVIQADIRIDSNRVGEAVLADVLFELTEFLSPQPNFHNLEEMLQKGYSFNEIFDGPPPVNGFIDTEDLNRSDLNIINSLYKSDLIQLVSQIDGVAAVPSFSILIKGKEVSTELIQLDAYTYPTLDIEMILDGASIRFFAGDIAYDIDRETARYSLDMLRAKRHRSHKRWLGLTIEKGASRRKSEEIEFFYSIQNTFPRAYGISEFGLQNRSTELRKAQAKQLKGYLVFFEQILANYLSQLVNLRKLFSVEESVEQTYFYQGLDTIPDVEPVLKNGKENFEKGLGDLIKKYDRNIERRNRFLDHLLARFGEEFMDDAYSAIHRESNVYTKESFGEKSISAKLKFLKNFIDISQNRAKGYDYSNSPFEPENVTGLKKKISLFFNMENYGNRALSNISRDKNVKVSKEKQPKKESAGKSGTFYFQTKNPNILSEMLAFGVSRNNYVIVKEKDQFVIRFIHPQTREEIEIYKDKILQKCEDDLQKLISRFKEINAEADGFHILEHVLLRPIAIQNAYHLIGDINRLIQSSDHDADSSKGREKFLKTLTQYGGNTKNYKIEKQGEKQFILKLINEKGNTVAFREGFVLKKSAEEAIHEIIRLLKEVAKKPSMLRTRIEVEQMSAKGGTFTDDPYSLQMSVLVPNWAGRFQSDKVKALFENVVRVNAPAHLRINFHWLNETEMAKFEAIYIPWLEEKANIEADLGALDKLSFDLMSMLRTL